MEEDYAVVYPVAGLSSRFAGQPKWLMVVGPDGETLMEYSMNQAIKAGFNKIIFVVGEHTENLFHERFGNSYRGLPIVYAKQEFNPEKRDRPWGTVDALCAIRDVIDCPFVFCNGDDIYGEGAFAKLIEHLKENQDKPATLGYNLLKTMPDEGSVNRGIFTVNDEGYVKNLVERFNIEKEKLNEVGLNEKSLCSMNIFAFNPEVVKRLDEILTQFKEEHKGDRKIECLLPNEIGNLAGSGEIKLICYPTDELWFGITNPGDEVKVREELLKLKNNNL